MSRGNGQDYPVLPQGTPAIVVDVDVEVLLEAAAKRDFDGGDDSESDIPTTFEETLPPPVPSSSSSPGPLPLHGNVAPKPRRASKSAYSKRKRARAIQKADQDYMASQLPVLPELTDSEDETPRAPDEFFEQTARARRPPKKIARLRASEANTPIEAALDFEKIATVNAPGWEGVVQKDQARQTYGLAECVAEGLRVVGEEEWNFRCVAFSSCHGASVNCSIEMPHPWWTGTVAR